MPAANNFWTKDWRFLAGKGKYYPEARGYPVFTTLSLGTRTDIYSNAIVVRTDIVTILSAATIRRILRHKPFYVYNMHDQKFRQPTVVSNARDVGTGMGSSGFRIF
jgi:Pyruvate/2-oxoacid:ferredoxin oxidoreductase gamma subunit